MSGSRRERVEQAYLGRQQAAADRVAAIEARRQSQPAYVAHKAALTQAVYHWAALMRLRVTGMKVTTAFGETFAFFTACDGDLAGQFHLCLRGGQTRAYLHADPVRYGNGHPANPINCEADLGDALARAETEAHRHHQH